MPNVLEYASVFQTELNSAAVAGATSGWMEPNERLIKYEGGADVKIPQMTMDGLADYDRSKGFTEGTVNLKWQTETMSQDRGRSFTLDANDVDETNFVASASRVMGEFQRKHVIPEIDAYRYSRIAAGAMEKNRAEYGYTPDAKNLLERLYADVAEVQDKIGSDVPLVISMSTKVAALFSTSDKLFRVLDTTTFKQGDINLQVKSLDGIHPIIRVGSGRFKTAYQFLDGVTEGQKAGGFKASDNALDINWIICPRTTPVAVSRTDNVRIFDPKTYQKAHAWKLDYRKYHDIWISDSEWDNMLVNIRQAKPAENGGA